VTRPHHCALAFVLGCALAPNSSYADVSARVQVAISENLDHLTGEARLELTNTSQVTLDHIVLWCFPNALEAPPPLMDEIAEAWVYPNRPNPARMVLGPARDGQGRELPMARTSPTEARVSLLEPVPPGGQVALEVAFDVLVPERFGLFGHANGELLVDDGFFPRPPPLGPAGFLTDAPPGEIRYELRARWLGPAREVWAVANGALMRLRGGEPPRLVAQGSAPRLTLVLLTDHRLSSLQAGQTRIAFIHRRPRVHEGRHPPAFRDLVQVDVHAESMATAGAGVLWLQRETGWTPPRRVVLVEAGLRRDLAVSAPGMVLVSDRAFEVIEIESVRKFHRVALLRALYATLLAPRLGPREPLDRRDQVLDLAALHLAERWEIQSYGSQRDAAELLASGAFLSEVDEVLYAPQVPMQHIYFRVVDDTDPYRDRFSLYYHGHPNGRRLHEKLRDLAGWEKLVAVVDRLLEPHGPPLAQALGEHIPAADEAFLARWDGPYPDLNYRLGAITPGADLHGPFVDVEIHRQGATDIVEPVTVGLVGAEPPVEATWHAPGPRGVARLRPPRPDPAPTILVDPHGRLEESDLGSTVDPKLDNRNYQDWKFLLAALRFDVSSSDRKLNGRIITALQERYDLAHTLLLSAYEEPAATGASLAWQYGFGPKIRPNLRRVAFSLQVRAEYLKPTAVDPHMFGAVVEAGIGDTTYLSRTDPQSGHALGASVGAVLGTDGELLRLGGYAHLRAAYLLPMAPGQILAGQLHLSTWFGEVGEGHRWAVGGPGLVRAYGARSAIGRHRILASLEWRHRMSRDLAVNVLQLGWLHTLSGVLFVDAALLADAYPDLFSEGAVYFDVGYGLRLHYHFAGVDPLMFGLDFAVPLHFGPHGWAKTFGLQVVLAVRQAF
jgi:hypothetical protein